MRNRPGDRQARDNARHKKDLGSSPNGVANGVLARMRGSRVTVVTAAAEYHGVLDSFDAFSVLLRDVSVACPGSEPVDALEVLVFKGPGVAIFPGL